MSESIACARVALRKFHDAVDEALILSTVNVLRAAREHPWLFNVNISSNANRDELRRMYKELDDRFLKISSLSITCGKHAGNPYAYVGIDKKTKEPIERKIPVTPVFQDVNNHTYHTITIRRKDGVTLVVLIRECDNYIVAVRVYRTAKEAENAPWLAFHGVVLPKSRFRNVVEMQYGYHHGTATDVKFGKTTFSELMDFLLEFQKKPDQATTDDGQLLLHSLFLVFGEGQRFRSVRRWVIRTSRRFKPRNVPAHIAVLFQKWSNLSKVCLQLYLALQEMEFLEPYLGTDQEQINYFSDSLSEALKSWRDAELEHRLCKSVLSGRFRNVHNKIFLECLVGGELLLLKHDLDWCTRILMRARNYTGDLKKNQKLSYPDSDAFMKQQLKKSLERPEKSSKEGEESSSH